LPLPVCLVGGLRNFSDPAAEPALYRTHEIQRSLQTRAVQISNDLAQVRFLLFVESESLIPTIIVW
jgi:hypothetical protein